MSHHNASGPAGGKAHFPGERSREGCTEVDRGKDVQMLPQVCRTLQKQKENTDLCTAPPRLYLWGSQWPPGRVTAGSNTNYSETTCPLLGLLGIWHNSSRYDTTHLENTYCVHFLFCSANCCTINRSTASLLLARCAKALLSPVLDHAPLDFVPYFFCKLQLLVF